MIKVVQPVDHRLDLYRIELARVAISLTFIYRGQVEVVIAGERVEDVSWASSPSMISRPTRVVKESLGVLELSGSLCFVASGATMPEWLEDMGIKEVVVPNQIEQESIYLGTWTYPRFSWIGEFLEKEYGLMRSV